MCRLLGPTFSLARSCHEARDTMAYVEYPCAGGGVRDGGDSSATVSSSSSSKESGCECPNQTSRERKHGPQLRCRQDRVRRTASGESGLTRACVGPRPIVAKRLFSGWAHRGQSTDPWASGVPAQDLTSGAANPRTGFPGNPHAVRVLSL